MKEKSTKLFEHYCGHHPDREQVLPDGTETFGASYRPATTAMP